MKKIITLLMLMFIVSISFAQYTPMTAAGYQFKRILCDSTLHIPSFCGIPTLRNSTAKNGAIAMDTCNYKFYMWTNIGGWSQIVGAGTDTTNKFVNNVTKINDTAIRVWKGTTSTVISLAKDVVYTQSPIMSKISNDSNIIYFNADTANAWRGGGGGSQNLQQVTDLGASTTNPIYIDNSNFSHIVLNRPSATAFDYTDVLAYSSTLDSSTSLNGFLIRDSTPGFTSVPNVYAYGQVGAANSDYSFGIENNNTLGALPFLRFNGGGKMFSLNESSIYFNNGSGTSLKWNIPTATSSDSYMPVSVNGNFPDNTGNIVLSGGGTGTVTDISQGYGIVASPTNPITTSGTIDVDTTTSGLSGKYLRIVDTTDKWVNNISRTLGKDSIIFFIGSTRYAIKDSSGGQNLQQVTDKGATTSNNILIQSGITESVQYKNNSIEFRYTSIDPYITQTLYPTPYYLNQKDTLPSGSGVLALSVNGVKADSSGNITLSGGGGGTVTSVDLTMPSAFTVTGNPVTTSGTLAVTGAGTVSQYVRGDGSLANFPTASGGGASVSYYLNGSVNQGTFGGATYYEMNGTPIIGAGTDFTINANGYIAQFITDVADPNKLLIPAGNWNFETYFSASSSGGSPSFYIELYKVSATNVFTLIASNSAAPENITGGTSIDLYFTALAVPSTTLLATDRLAVRFFVTHSGRTITMHTEDNHLTQIITTFSTGLTALNGLTAQVQNFATGTSGTDFGISSSTATHTFNLPTASATNRGALSSTDWSTFNGKIGASDTSVFQRKSISAYTMLANNTNAAANATGQTFRDTAGTYAGTITWTGTAPTTQTINYYQWQQTGKWVRLQIFGNYTNAGTACTAVQLTLPADCPAPDISMFATGALAILYQGLGGLGTSGTSVSLTTNAYMRRNAANNGNELFVSAASNNYRRYQVDITYRAQ